MTTVDAATELKDLPGWDLTDLYPGRESAELAAALESAASDAKSFNKKDAGKLASLNGDDLAAAVAVYEDLQEVIGRIGSFAFLTYATDMSDTEIGQFFQNMQEKLNDVTTDLLFFTLEMNRLEEEALEKLYAGSENLSRYQPGAVEWNLYDMDAKFGDVEPLEAVLDHMRKNT